MQITKIDLAMLGLVFIIVLALIFQRWIQTPPDVLTVLKDTLLPLVTLFAGKKIQQNL